MSLLGGLVLLPTDLAEAATIPEFQRADGLTFEEGEDGGGAAAIDPDGTSAYFGTNTFPGQLVKVDLSTFERVDALSFGPDEASATAAAVDPAGDFAYFGTSQAPSRLVKVDLATFQRVDALVLAPEEGIVNSIAVDPVGGFAYLVVQSGRVVKVDLATFTRVGHIDLAAPSSPTYLNMDPSGAFLYVGIESSPAQLRKIDLATFTEVDQLILEPGEDTAARMFIDPSGGHIYLVTLTFPAQVVKVDLATFERVDAATLDPGDGQVGATAIDPSGDFAYLGLFETPGRVVRVDLTNMERVDVISLGLGEVEPGHAVVDPDGLFAYFTSFSSPGRVAKISLSCVEPDPEDDFEGDGPGGICDPDNGGPEVPPELSWANTSSAATDSRAESVAVDPAGNVYVAGRAGFVSKSDPDGNLIWERRPEGSPGSSPINGVALDAAANVFVAGSFNGTVDFDPGPGVFELTSTAASDIFVMKLDSDGNFLWVSPMSGTGSEIAFAVTADGDGNVITTGRFTQTVDFDPGPGTFNLTSASGQQLFVSKLDPNGEFLMAVTPVGGGPGDDEGFDVTTDSAGNIYTTGYFTTAADFDPGPGVFNLTGSSREAFVWMIDPAGNLGWAKSFGGSATGSDRGYGIALDDAGNVIFTGSFVGTADFDPGAGVYELTSGGDSLNIYVAKLDSSGDFIWARHAEGFESSEGAAVAVDGAGNVYSTGGYLGETDFDPSPGAYLLSPSARTDAYVWKLTQDGDFAWVVATRGEGSINDNEGFDIASDGAAGVVTVGSFRDAADFDPGPGIHELDSPGLDRAFIWKLSGPVSDGDGDGVSDGTDNCPLDANTDQADFDGDGSGDVCDPDIDDDGIANGVDPDDVNDANESFDDGTGTFGTIVDRGGLDLSIVAAADIQITASGGAGTAVLRVCLDDFELNLTAGDSVLITCGSLTMEVVAGPVEVTLADGEIVVTVSTGATSLIVANPDGTFQIENVGSTGVVTVTHGDEIVVLEPGDEGEFGALSPAEAIDAAIAELDALHPTGDRKDDKHLENAIDALTKSRNPAWWIDDTTLDPKKGTKVFAEESRAVSQLANVVHIDLTEIIDSLVEGDAQLAQTNIDLAQAAIDEAIGQGGDAKKIAKAQNQLAKALEHFAAAADEIAAGRDDKAIDRYGKAWDFAQQALEGAEQAVS